jgi:branched-chain amino acid transport system ATP-binding protein
MLAVARAMMCRPRLLLLDEPSLGLAPLVIQSLFDRFSALNKDEGVTLVHRRAERERGTRHRRSRLRDRGGRIVLTVGADELRENDRRATGVFGLLGGTMGILAVPGIVEKFFNLTLFLQNLTNAWPMARSTR